MPDGTQCRADLSPKGQQETVSSTIFSADNEESAVELVSDIPRGHPAKAVFEAALLHLMRRAREPWRIEILLTGGGAWWLISFERATDGFRTMTLLGPDKQTPEVLAALGPSLFLES